MLKAALVVVPLLLGFIVRAQSPACTMSVQLLLNLNGGASNTADGCLVLYKNNFSTTIGNEDVQKFDNMDENLAIYRDGTLLSMEGRPPFASYDTVPLRIWQFRQTSYFLKFSCTNFPSAMNAILKDNYLQQDLPIDLANSDIISFSISADSGSFAADRFCVVFRPAGTLAIEMSNVNAVTRGTGIKVDWTSSSEINIDHYEIERRANSDKFETAAIIYPSYGAASSGSTTYSWYDASPVTGDNFYRIKAIDKWGKISYSAVVKASKNSGSQGISIYPNPVKGNVVGLNLNNLDAGKYAVCLYNNSGQKVYNSYINHGGGSSQQSMRVNTKLTKGVYRLQLTNNTQQFIQTLLLD